MHELSLIRPVLKMALAISDEHGGLRITSVKLRVGALRQAVPELMTFAFEAAAAGTAAEGASLQLEEVPARIACHVCSREFEPEDVFWQCPECNAFGGRVVAGEELMLETVSLEEAVKPAEYRG